MLAIAGLILAQSISRPVADLSRPITLKLKRTLAEFGRPEDARKETATWVWQPNGDAQFTPETFVPGVLGRLSSKALQDEKPLFMGVSGAKASPLPLPLKGDFLQNALASLGPQLIGSPDRDAVWTAKWLPRGVATVQVTFGKTQRMGDIRGVASWMGTAEWDESLRRGLARDETRTTGTSKASGWVFLAKGTGLPLGWELKWTIDLPSNRGRLELLDTLTVESSVG